MFYIQPSLFYTTVLFILSVSVLVFAILAEKRITMSDIHIKPENRGKFTALKERTGHSASWFKEHGTPAQKKMATFALNARKWNHADGGLLISPEKKKLLDRINSSKADFIQRMKDPNRAFITNPDGSVSTHRMAYVTNGDDAVVYPEIQNIGGELVEIPADMAYQSAIDRGDTLHMTPRQAKWFTRKYKKFYPFNTYADGGSAVDGVLRDYLAESGDPMSEVLSIDTSPVSSQPVVYKPEVPDIGAVMSYSPAVSPVSSDTPIMDRMARVAGLAASTAALRRSVPSPIKRIIMPEETQPINTEYTPSENLIQSLMSYEGFKDRPYNKLDGKWTIGYGDTDKDLNDYYLKNKDKRYSREEAEKRLRDRVATEFVGYAKKYTPNWDKLTPAQKDSLVSYIYNIGPGSYSKKHPKLMKALREMNMKEIAANIDAGFNDESKPGLRKRRIAERQAFLHPETEYYGQTFSVGGTLEKLENAYGSDTQAMLEAVKKAKMNNS